MLLKYLRLRLTQLKREIDAIGFLYVLLTFAALAYFSLIIFDIAAKPPNSYYIAGLWYMLIVAIHVNRKDKRFLKTAVPRPYAIYTGEYLSMSIPMMLMLLFSAQWMPCLLLIIAIGAIPLVTIETKVSAGRIQFSKFLPKENFEWIAGFRRNVFILIPMYIAAIGLSYMNYVSLILLWLMVVIIASFYQYAEPLIILQLNELGPRKFIHQKLKSHLNLFMLFALPIILLYSIFNPDTFWVGILVLAMSLINVSLIIVSKYSFYQPNIKLTANAFIIGLALISIVLPFLIPIPLIMAVREYRRSIKNLSAYLHAYD